MKKLLFVLTLTFVASGLSAKANLHEDESVKTAAQKKFSFTKEQAKKLIELNRKEDAAHSALQAAEQAAALSGKITAELVDARTAYQKAKDALEKAISKLPNRKEIEQWLIDNHIHAGSN